ncbi:hypothetical protein FS842_008704 [Serendipita sp. 407]|nr:hypothetical protein FS842_008704 [Serendipita sp. 407]
MFNETPNGNVYGDGDSGEWRDWSSFFKPRTSYEHGWGRIEDDHIPFVHRGVNVLHIIASPFPRVWHTLQDDASALDIPTMKRWNLIFRVFATEYLRLNPSRQKAAKRSIKEDIVRV